MDLVLPKACAVADVGDEHILEDAQCGAILILDRRCAPTTASWKSKLVTRGHAHEAGDGVW